MIPGDGQTASGSEMPLTTVDPSTHLTRFSAEERRILGRFVARVAELRASRFLVESAHPLTLKLDFVGGIATNLRLDGPGRPEVQEVMERSASSTDIGSRPLP